MNGNLWTVAVLVVLCALLLPAVVNIGYQNTARTTVVNDEAVTIDYQTNVTVDEDGSKFFDNETITTDSGNTTLTEGTDYKWNTTTGTINWLNSSTTSDGETARIDYAVESHDQTTTNIVSVLAPWATILGLSVFVVGMFAFINMVYDGGGGGF